ncbi:MAG: EAL domain-containing protein [Henriciella sp.]|nr:EAL domain-containing protein [Henriciella sp.]
MSNPFTKQFSKLLKLPGFVSSPELTPETQRNFRRAQIDSVAELSSILTLGSLLNVMVLILSFWNTSIAHLTTGWGIAMILVLMAVSFSNRSFRKGNKPHLSTKVRHQRFERASLLIGVMWAVVPIITIPLSNTFGFAAVCMLSTGTMFAGVALIGRMPRAAMKFVFPVIAGMLIALQLQHDPRNGLLSVLTLAFAGVLFVMTRISYAQFAVQHLNKSALEDQAEVISLLLRDFEETTSDWLWEIDAEARLSALPTEIQKSGDQNGKLVIGERFLKAFEDGPDLDKMVSDIGNRRPFKDRVVRLCVSDTEVWWSITGKPLFEKGQFTGFRGVATDVTQSKLDEDRIRFMAHNDLLTELPNRSQLSQRLLEISQDFDTDEDHYALVWLDLDNFKWVNDTLGHQAGDRVLQEIAKRLRTHADRPDDVARISGDEFALILRYREKEHLTAELDDVAAHLAEPHHIWGSTVLCRASMGVKQLTHGNFDISTVLKQADLALYHSKEREKGTWSLFDHSIQEKARAVRELEVDLNRALERNELRLYYQPIVDANSKDVVACETLLRWQHPSRGLLMPDSFIGFAEDTGVITRLGDWVIRQALSEARQLPENIRIAINISPLQIHSANLIPTVINSLASNGIAAGRLELEITESVLISERSFVIERLSQLRALGVRIALDDFGTGFSSMSYLRDFPFDKMKVDKSFIADLQYSRESQAIALAMLNMAKALGMTCTGEGVETLEQEAFLRRNGCDEIQGYIVSRPKPMEDLIQQFEPTLERSDQMAQSDQDVAKTTHASRPRIVAGRKA